MPVILADRDGDKGLEVRISGRLTHADYEQFVPAFERLVKKHGKIRVLFEMADFHGWDAVALWDDLKFDLKHFADIEQLALVGDKKWERGMAVFCRPFTTATMFASSNGTNSSAPSLQKSARDFANRRFT